MNKTGRGSQSKLSIYVKTVISRCYIFNHNTKGWIIGNLQDYYFNKQAH